MSKFVDLTGQKFDKLTVIKRVEYKNKHAYWLCKCDCGNETIVNTQRLTKGLTKSCGCLRSVSAIKKNTTFNISKTRIYKIWQEIKRRCYNTKCNCYSRYGGRNITMCNEWLENPKTFYDWAINNGYKENLSIDRIDVNGNYEPFNCRWVSNKQQANNKRNNRFITFNGQTHTMAEWARIYNISYKILADRISKGWNIEKALFTKVYTNSESGRLGGKLSHHK